MLSSGVGHGLDSRGASRTLFCGLGLGKRSCLHYWVSKITRSSTSAETMLRLCNNTMLWKFCKSRNICLNIILTVTHQADYSNSICNMSSADIVHRNWVLDSSIQLSSECNDWAGFKIISAEAMNVRSTFVRPVLNLLKSTLWPFGAWWSPWLQTSGEQCQREISDKMPLLYYN